MIYLFDRAKKLQKIIPRKHLTDVKQTVVRNGLYQLSVTAPLFYETSKGTKYNHQKSIEKAWFAGHFDTDNRFQLYKIHTRNITADKSGEFILFDGVHIFFDEAKAMGNIHDRRFRDSEAKPAADAAFNLIGWTVTDYDVTDRHDINFYRASVTDAWNDLISTFNVEFDYELQFDGRKIISKNIIMKNKLGRWTGQRHAYGTNLLSLTQEQREGDIYTAAVGRGRGEEAGDGFGPRLEFGDIEWSKDGIEKPVGQNWIEIPSATAEYGYYEDGELKPRFAPEVVFDDIENKQLLADNTYQWLLENCIPKATWKTEVSRFGHLNLGDGVGILYKDADIIKRARVEKIEHNLLDPKLSKLTLGDYHYFNQDKRQQRIDSTINRIRREANSRITQMKNEYTAWFDAQTLAIKNAHEQAVIDANANIQAAEERMETLIEYERDTMMNEFNEDVQEARNYAEQQAQEKAAAVRTDLETVTSGHQSMLDDLESNVMNIDDFIGDKTIGLNELLYNERMLFEEKLNNVDTWHYNILRGTRFDEGFWQGSNMEIASDGSLNYFEFVPSRNTSNVPYIQSNQEVVFNAGETYTLSFDFQTYSVSREVDYIFIIASIDDGGSNMNIWHPNLIEDGTHLNTSYGEEFQRYWVRFKPARTIRGFVRIGLNMEGETRRGFRLALPYLTQTANTRWLYNQLDNTQNIEEITRRVNKLEDGREEFITKTQYDFETGEIQGTIRNILETVDESSSLIANHDDWIINEGSHVSQMADEVFSKVWLSDIHNPNLLSFTDVAELSHRSKWGRWRAPTTGSAYSEFARFRNTSVDSQIGAISPNLEIIEGETYTLTWIAFIYDDTLNHFDYCYIMTPDGNVGISPLSNRPKRTLIPTAEGSYGGNPLYKYELTFTAPIGHKKANVMIGATAKTNGTDASFAFKEPKLELGDRATPYHNAYSMFNQRADNIVLQVDDQESRISNFTVDLDGILGRVSDIEGDYITQSSLEITPEYAQIGSMRIDGDTVGSLLRVSPSGIDAVAEAMRLSGDLYVDGDITSLAVDVIEGNFARLFADQLTAGVITADHLAVDTAMLEKFFSTSARIDTLISKTHFVNEIKATSIDAVYADLRSVNSEIMDTNILKADWIQGGNALLDKVFANTAMFERMMAKSGFISTMSAITLDLHELTIWRPDGVPVIQNGMQRFGLPVTFVQQVDGGGAGDVSIHPNYWETNSRGSKAVGAIFTEHAGRWLNVGVGVGLRSDSDSNSTYMAVVLRPNNVPSGVSWFNHIEEFMVYRGRTDYHVINVPLGRPTFGASSWTLEFYRIGDSNHRNPVQLRRRRMWVSA